MKTESVVACEIICSATEKFFHYKTTSKLI